jgi:glycosyltransferase involved in cell wall biosynthesis
MGLEFAYRYGCGPIIFTNHTRYDLYLSAYTGLHETFSQIVMRYIWPFMTRECDLVVAPSASIQQLLRNIGVQRPIEIIENGIELDHFRFPSKRFKKSELGIPEDAQLLVYAGRLSPEKGVDGLLHQFILASRQSDKCHLMLLGDGPLKKQLHREACQAGLAHRVHLAGLILPEKIPAYLAAADAFVTASVSEVHPLSVIEAMAAGLPAIAIDSPGISDIVKNRINGLLVAGSDLLSKAMVEVLNEPDLCLSLGMAAAKTSKQYDIKNTVQKTLNLYYRLMEKRKPFLRRREDQNYGTGERTRITEQVTEKMSGTKLITSGLWNQ